MDHRLAQTPQKAFSEVRVHGGTTQVDFEVDRPPPADSPPEDLLTTMVKETVLIYKNFEKMKKVKLFRISHISDTVIMIKTLLTVRWDLCQLRISYQLLLKSTDSMVTKSCCAWRLALGGKRWTFILIASEASRCSFTMQAYILSELSKRSRPFACSDIPAALTAKKKGSHSVACRRTDADMYWKDCKVVQDWCGGIPWKTKQQTKREDKDENRQKRS